MLRFFQDNAGTLIVGAVVFAIVAAVIIKLIIDRRRKGPGCSYGCSGCAAGDCASVETQAKGR